MGGATRQWVWQPPHTKGEEGDPGPVFLSNQPSSRRQPSRLVPRWGSLQHYTRQALMTSILFPYWAQDCLPPRDSRKKAWKLSSSREIPQQYTPKSGSFFVPTGSRFLSPNERHWGTGWHQQEDPVTVSTEPGNALHPL